MLRAATATVVATLTVTVLAADAMAQRGAPPIRRVEKLENPAPFTRHSLPAGDHHADPSTLPPAVRREALPAIVLTGYWPPSNEMIRPFSTDPVQNPGGWRGANWEGRGYDVYSFFPEFTPPDCNNCGKGTGDLEVDYQDTSNDFWPIVDGLDPIAVITFSRGFTDNSWEVEMNQFNRSSWINDYVSPLQPTPAPPDASVPADTKRLSRLPAQDIVDAVNLSGLPMNAYICFAGDGGGFLSEFMAYHGVWYQSIHRSPAFPDWCATAGHVHVGYTNSWLNSAFATQITLREVIQYVDATVANTICQPDLGFGGPGSATQVVCGQPLSAGNNADLFLSGAPASQTVFLVAGFASNPISWMGGTLVPLPPTVFRGIKTAADGTVFLEGIPGGGGPVTVYTQFVYPDVAQVDGWGFSNVVGIQFLP